jgi:Ni,Fe-hydrogenase III component G
MDIAICEMIGIEPAGVPVLKRAKIRNLWPESVEYPLLKPEDIPINRFKLPNTAATC